MAYKRISPIVVTEGGTGAKTFTAHGVLLGEGTSAIAALAAAATGATLMGSTGADPAFTGSPSFSGSVTAATGLVNTTGTVTINSGASTMTLSGDASATAVNIARGAGVKTLVMGSTNTTSQTEIFSGPSGSGILLSSQGALTEINSGTGNVFISHSNNANTTQIADGAAAKALILGSTNTSSSTTINSGSGGVTMTGVAGVSVSNKNYVSINTSTGLLGSDTGPSTSITLTGDTGGGLTGNSFTFDANSQAGSTILFAGSGTTLSLDVSDANNNTILGQTAGNGSISGAQNTGFGYGALNALTSGSGIVGVGYTACAFNQTGTGCVGVGYAALYQNVSGLRNTGIGEQALGQLGSEVNGGDYNAALGWQAGINYTGLESDNICINASSTTVIGENNVLRIGDGTGTGTQQLSSAYISGINGVSQGGTISLVTINGSDQLGSVLGSPIITIDGDTGSATGSTITFDAVSQAGSSVNFSATGSTVSLNVTDVSENTLIGQLCGNATLSGNNNTGLGFTALNALTTGTQNTAIGLQALANCTQGAGNLAFGQNATYSLNTGSYNTCFGFNALFGLLTGQYNIGIGFEPAANYAGAESNNIIIGASTTPVLGENNTLRIGDGTGGGTRQLASAYISGIFGSTVGVSGVPVVVDNTDLLGTVVSSARYKTNIEDMGEASSRIYDLRPVTFEYKKQLGHISYGLIAEEVAESFPELAVFNADGDAETVRYLDLIPMLLNEVQKLREEINILKGM